MTNEIKNHKNIYLGQTNTHPVIIWKIEEIWKNGKISMKYMGFLDILWIFSFSSNDHKNTPIATNDMENWDVLWMKYDLDGMLSLFTQIEALITSIFSILDRLDIGSILKLPLFKVTHNN